MFFLDYACNVGVEMLSKFHLCLVNIVHSKIALQMRLGPPHNAPLFRARKTKIENTKVIATFSHAHDVHNYLEFE